MAPARAWRMRFQLRPGFVLSLSLSQRASSEWGALAQEEGDGPDEEDEYFSAALNELCNKALRAMLSEDIQLVRRTAGARSPVCREAAGRSADPQPGTGACR